METISKSITKPVVRPVKILQYGEGNFLRGFVDYMIDIANEKEVFDGNIVITKPISHGSLEEFHKQEYQYTVYLRGLEDGKPKVISRPIRSISDAVGAYEDYEAYMAYARQESLRFIVSNTTEAGIVYDEKDSYEANPPKTFPGKLTKFIYERYNYFKGAGDKGLIILPCELIENNGAMLKECVLKYANLWKLDESFINWVNQNCVFCNTLVDRIITGYPHNEAEEYFKELGYYDRLIVSGELFCLWVIESDVDISKEFPMDKAGLPVLFTKDLQPYRERKVRVLNGAHTSFAAASFLAGRDSVKETMDDNLIRKYVMEIIFNEVIPTLSLPKEELESFANKVIERFENPFIKHSLLSISLNSVSKWKTRCLPSFKEYVSLYNKLPLGLTFSLAALIGLYHGKQLSNDGLTCFREGEEYKIMDDEQVMTFFDGANTKDNRKLTEEFLSRENFFGEDMTRYSGLVTAVSSHLKQIRSYGMRKAIENLMG